MRKISAILIFLLLLYSCKEDNIIIPKAGDTPFTFTRARIELIADGETNIGFVKINLLGYVICDSIRISYNGFARTYSFIGTIDNDTSVSIIVTPKDSAANDRLKLNAKQTGSILTGSLLYCNNASNCSYTEIGNIIGFYTNRFEGFYYTPLFLGEYYIYPMEEN